MFPPQGKHSARHHRQSQTVVHVFPSTLLPAPPQCYRLCPIMLIPSPARHRLTWPRVSPAKRPGGWTLKVVCAQLPTRPSLRKPSKQTATQTSLAKPGAQGCMGCMQGLCDTTQHGHLQLQGRTPAPSSSCCEKLSLFFSCLKYSQLSLSCFLPVSCSKR
jgi:hypothetical protein